MLIKISMAGVAHVDDLMHLFPLRERLFPHSLPTEDDEQIRQSFIRLWIDYARTGYVRF